MRRFLFFFFLLVIAALTAFGFGYVPIRLDPGNLYLLHSRTSGWDATVFENGTFSWRWELLVPKNATLVAFDGTSRSVILRVNNTLPSGELYSTALDGRPSFDYSAEAQLQYRLDATQISTMASRGFQSEDQGEWFQHMDGLLAATAEDAIANTTERVADRGQRLVSSADLVESVTSEIERRHPEIEVVAASVSDISLPDYELYQLAREQFQENERVRNQIRRQTLTALTQRQVEDAVRLEVLEKYGAILDRYPVLVDYLRAVAETGGDPLGFEDLRLSVPESAF